MATRTRTGRTYFTSRDRLALAARSGWRCELCGRPLQNNDPTQPDYLHAGHVVAHVDGGGTDITNGRAECAACSTMGGGVIRTQRGRSQRTGRGRAAAGRVFVAATGSGDLPRTSPPSGGEWAASAEILRGWPHLAEFVDVPAESCLPRIMTPPPANVTGTYGGMVAARGEGRLRWWQRLVAARILEHDTDGALVHGEWLLSVARQAGKSHLLRALAFARLDMAQWLGPQVVAQLAQTALTAAQLQRRARLWAAGQEGWRERSGNSRIGVEAPDGSQWVVATPGGVFGWTIELLMLDEAWSLPPAMVEDELEPTQLAATEPQRGLISTANPHTTVLFPGRRAAVLESGAGLLIEWSAPPGSDAGDRAMWRAASPHWTKQRADQMALTYDRAAHPSAARVAAGDPMRTFRCQYLNEWPDLLDMSTAGVAAEALVSEVAWIRCGGSAVPEGPVVFGIDDHAGVSTIVAAAGRAGSGFTVEVFVFGDREEAFAFVSGHAAARPDSSAVVGYTLRGSSETTRLAGTVPVRLADAAVNTGAVRAGLGLLRSLVSADRLTWEGQLLDAEVRAMRVTADRGGGVRVVSSDRWEAVRLAGLALREAESLAHSAPMVY